MGRAVIVPEPAVTPRLANDNLRRAPHGEIVAHVPRFPGGLALVLSMTSTSSPA